jgi:hypothetical protein
MPGKDWPTSKALITRLLILMISLPLLPAGAVGSETEGGVIPRISDDANDLIVPSGETYELSGCHTYARSVQINGILKVKPYDGADDTTGTLTLIAPVMTVGSSGMIVADGRGYGGGGAGTCWYSTGKPGGMGGGGGNGGAGAASAYTSAGGGGGGSNGGTGGSSSYGAGASGWAAGGGNGGATGSYKGGVGGSGFGGGGGGGASGSSYGGGGGGGGGSGGKNAAEKLGGAGAGPSAGAGGQSFDKYYDSVENAQNGGYKVAGGNGDTSTDPSVIKGGGGGGGGASCYYTGGGGGGGAGGGAVMLISSGNIAVAGAISTTGAGGGAGGYYSTSTSYPGGQGGGGAGGGILLSGLNVAVTGSLDARGRTGNTQSTTNGGTVKILYQYDQSGSATIQAGRIFNNGRPRMGDLVSPENDGAALLRTVFSWNAARDPESEPVTYHIQVSGTGDFSSLEQDVEGIRGTEYTSDKDLIGASFYWRVRAADACGYGSWSPVWIFFTESIPPDSHVNALPKYTNTANFTVSWTGTDDASGIATYDIFVAEGTGTLSFLPWLENFCRTSAIYPGKDGKKYSFYSVATDRAHNREADPTAADTFTTVDITPPVTTMGALAPCLGVLDFELSWSGKDAISGIQYYNVYVTEGDGDFELWQEHVTKTTDQFEADDGREYRFYAIACDNAGNWEAMPATSKILKVKVDLIPPEAEVRIGSPQNGSDPVFISGATPIYIDGTDNFAGINSTFYIIDDSGVRTFANSLKEGTPGSHNMTFWCTDKAGNRGANGELWFFVDAESPSSFVSCEGPGHISGDKVYLTASTSVLLSADDSASGVDYIEYSLDKRSYARYTMPLKFTSGNHSLLFRGVDKVGNIETEHSVMVILDTTAPTTRPDWDVPTSSNADVTITLVAMDSESGVAGTFFRVVREREKAADYQAGTSITVAAGSGGSEDGNYTVQYYSVDNVNNAEKVKELKLRIDTQVALHFGFAGEPSVSEKSYLLEGKTEPGSKVTVGIIDVQLAADGSFAHELTLNPGKNKVTVTITDPAGNIFTKVVYITYNEPIVSAGWFLPLVVIIIFGAVGAGAFLYMRRKKGAAPPVAPPRGKPGPQTQRARAPPRRAPPPPPPIPPPTP